MLHFACSDAMLLTDIEARNQISHCLGGYSVSQVRECCLPIYFDLVLRTGYKVKERRF